MKLAYKSFKFNRKFGIEVEVGRSVDKSVLIKAISDISSRGVKYIDLNANSINNKSWHVKIDSSCSDSGKDGDFGYEIASFVGHIPDDINHISQIINNLKDSGVKINNNCGLHIHSNVFDFTVNQMGILLALWLKTEHIFRYIISNNRLFDFCWPLVDYIASEDPDYQNKTIYPVELYYLFHPFNEDEEIEGKYRGLNIVNYAKCLMDKRRKRPTLELRFPESTLEVEDANSWIRLFINFIETAKHAKMPVNLKPSLLLEGLSLLGLHHTDEEFYILTPVLYKTKIWVLNRIIKHLSALEFLDNLENSTLKSAKKLLKTMQI